MTKLLLRLLLVCVVVFGIVNGQRNSRRQNNGRQNNNRRPNRRPSSGGVTRNGSKDKAGTEVYPGCDGKVCLPEAKLCAVRKLQTGHDTFKGQSYWFSWESDEPALKNARWNWFTARNYCRKRCMDLISVESQKEMDFLGGHMRSPKTQIQEVWTSARLCDKEVDGCEADRFQPYNVNGWFWAATLGLMGPTNVKNGRKYNGWSHTGPNGKPQPDGILKADGFGNQACAALLDNRFNDGLAWHDTKCNDRRQIICEDLPRGNIQFVRQQNPGVTIP